MSLLRFYHHLCSLLQWPQIKLPILHLFWFHQCQIMQGDGGSKTLVLVPLNKVQVIWEYWVNHGRHRWVITRVCNPLRVSRPKVWKMTRRATWLKVCIDEFTFDLMVCLYTCYRICFHSELDWNLHFASYGMFFQEWMWMVLFWIFSCLRGFACCVVVDNAEKEVLLENSIVLRETPCRWQSCELVLNSSSALIRHLNILHGPRRVDATVRSRGFMHRCT